MPEQNSSISSFKHFLSRIVLPLVIITGSVGWLFNYAFERGIILNSEISGAYKIERIIAETHPEEIPIFGSSRAEGTYIPDSLGQNIFNYGLSGSCADVAIFFMKQECLKKKKHPWIIVNIDLNGLTRQYGNIASFIPNSNNEDIRHILGNDYKGYYTIPFLKYFGQYEYYVRDFLNNKMQLTKVSNKGAAIEKKLLTASQFDALVQQRLSYGEGLSIDSALMQEFKAIITSHPEREFVFVVAPYHYSFYKSYQTPHEAEEYLRMLASFPNTHVLDFGHMPLSDDMYLNTSHLHFKGATIFCRALRDSLLAIGVTHG